MEVTEAESDIAPDAIHADRAFGAHRSPEPLFLFVERWHEQGGAPAVV
jgi:hypothetical protein